MLIPLLLGALAVLAVAAGGVMAMSGSHRSARGLVVMSLACGTVGVALAVETEIRYRECRADRVGEIHVPGLGSTWRPCQRWPW